MNKRYPFKFLDAYDRTDTDIFFGRDEEIEALYQMTFQSDILLVYGASGTGKTSLIQCGLASRFEVHDWLALTVRRGHDLNQTLQQKLEKATAGATAGAPDLDLSWLDEEEEVKAAAAESPLSRQLAAIYRQYFRPVYLIFDQFEELYILGTKAEQAQFVQNVKEIQAVDQPVKMIFVIREEYLGHLFEFERAVPQLLRKKLRVEPMNLDKVGQVIRGAAALPGSNVRLAAGQEDAIVEGIFQKIRGNAQALAIQLPYLQVFLDKFYLHVTGDEDRQADAVFTPQALAELGDIGDVLRDFLAEQAVRIQADLSRRHPDLPDDAVWQILSPLATLEGTKEPLLETTLIQRLPHLPPAVVSAGLRQLEQSRILRYDEQEGRYEVAHDSLAARIAEHRSDEEIALLEIRRLISSQLALKAEARALFTEKQLNLIDPYLEKLGLEPEARQLIEDSRREVVAKARRRRRRNLVIGSVLAGAAIVSVFFALQANTKAQEALQANEDTKIALAAAEKEKIRSDFLSQEARAAAAEALAEKARSDSLSDEAQVARDQAQSALTGLQKTTAQIFDNLLVAAEEDILHLDYETALKEIMNAGDLKVNDQKAGKALMEIVYVYNEEGRHQAAVDLTAELRPLLRADRFRLDQGQDTLTALRGYLEKMDAARFTFLKNRYFPAMVAVPGGTFNMGCDSTIYSNCGSDEIQHEVTVDDFQMAKHETTWWQYHLFCRATGHEYQSPSWGVDGDNPVVYVSWYDAIEYANWVSRQLGRDTVYGDERQVDWSKNGYRLPTEAEWEYAAKGGKPVQEFIYSGADSLNLVGWYGGNSDTGDGIKRTRAAAQKVANGLGLYDMSGNVWEWCWDRYAAYDLEDLDNPKGPDEGSARVIRGGSWYNTALHCRVTYRSDYYPEDRNTSLGFRLVGALQFNGQ